jgi:glucose/arabinose dehydrogenase
MLYKKDPTAAVSPSYGRVTRLRSTDGGRTMSQRTDVLNMAGEYSAYSHQIANVSIGPDRKLYVQNGDAVIPKDALNLDSWRGKIFRLNLDGSAPSDNPFYNKDNGINARDYVFAYGLRNPFGGAWRSSDASLYFVENGPTSNDRLAKARRGVSYGWNGEAASLKINAVYNWTSTQAPVNIAFIQNSSFGGSNFPANKLNHAFVTESGPTYATGPQSRGKRIREFVIDSTGKLVGTPTILAHYTGNGKETAGGIAAGPDGLYFTSLYRDDPINGTFLATHRGANIYRIRYVGN